MAKTQGDKKTSDQTTVSRATTNNGDEKNSEKSDENTSN
jgi:hypothetical protein